MPMENDEEFEPFYDFSRQYKSLNFPRAGNKAIEQSNEDDPVKDANGDIEEVSSDDWEECDVEDGFEDIEEEKETATANESSEQKTESL